MRSLLFRAFSRAFFRGSHTTTFVTCGLIVDGAGNAYGTTSMCGEYGYCPDGYGGTVFKLNGSTLETLYNFCQIDGCEDGQMPNAGLIQDAAGNLFGTTAGGGISGYYGTVFEISP